MRLSWGHLLAGALLACFAGCGGLTEPQPEKGPYSGPAINASIAFDYDGTLTMAPGDIAQLTVTTKPIERYEISFYLLGAALDASLDEATVVADQQGRATVELTAPNGATNFVLRATIKDGPSADLNVSVSAEGFGTLDIQPSYSGKRDVDQWQAFVVSGTSCAVLAPSFPEEPAGALSASAPPDYPLLIDDAPVGPNLSVFVRAAKYAWGCSDEPGLMAGATKVVEVKIVNKPVVTSEADLDVEMTLSPEATPWQALVDAQAGLMLEAFFAQQSPAEMLLAQMSQLSNDPSGFDNASLQNDWQTDLDSHLASHQVDISAAILTWLATGLGSQPPLLHGRLLGQSNGHAQFILSAFGGLDPGEIGAPADYVMPLKVDPDDTVRFGGTFYWQPSRHLGTTIERQALFETQLGDFEAVLADLVACDQLALAGYSGCGTACMQQLCADALGARWDLALDASADNNLPAVLPFEASGPASFDEGAGLMGFAGTWLGNIAVGSLSTKVTGAIVAEPGAVPAE